MRVGVVTPATAGARNGNRVTALRWARCLRALGHEVVLRERYEGEPLDVLIALHARRSAASIERFARESAARAGGRRWLVVALTGTDLYGDLTSDAAARRSVDLATRLVLLQPLGRSRLPAGAVEKARVIRQSACAARDPIRPPAGTFRVCVLGHLRAVKDPFLAASASRLLPRSSAIEVLHLGGALDEESRSRALREVEENPRWHWLGARPRREALRLLAGSSVLALTSVSEGGANAVTEAIAASVPVISTRIEGSLGILGEDHPGYFPVGDARALADLWLRCEADEGFLAELRGRSVGLRPMVDPLREKEAWGALLEEVRGG